MQICPQNHADYEVFSIYYDVAVRKPACLADLSAIARRATAEAYGRRQVNKSQKHHPHTPSKLRIEIPAYSLQIASP